jgi:heme exporter protein C
LGIVIAGFKFYLIDHIVIYIGRIWRWPPGPQAYLLDCLRKAENSSMQRFANPVRFMALALPCLPWLTVATFAVLGWGLYLALLNSPADYQQSETVRIMYVHVPSAWMALFVYTAMAVASLVAVIWRHPLAEIAAQASAPIGAAFTFCALVTGSLWGKPMWGTWWVWDARLTSVLILFFIYIAHMALSQAFDDPARGRRAAAILCLVGFVNVPIIKFSVEWWNTLHQPASVLKAGGPSIHADMLWPLLVMALAFKLAYLCLLIVRMRNGLAEAKIRSLTLAKTRG